MRTHQTVIAFLGHSFNDIDCGLYFTFDYDGSSQFKIRLGGIPGNIIYIHWTDRNYTRVQFDNYTYKDIYSSYDVHDTYNIKITGSCNSLKFIEVIDQPNVTLNLTNKLIGNNITGLDFKNIDVVGDISNLSGLTSLQFIRINSNNLSGDLSSIDTLHNLDYLNLSDTNITGDIAILTNYSNIGHILLYNTSINGNIVVFSTLNNLKVIDLHNTSVDGDIYMALDSCSPYYIDLSNTSVNCSDITDQMNFNANYGFFVYDCNLSSTNVDNILISLADSAKHSGSIRLDGNNAAHTPASDHALNRLIANGSNVKVN